MKRIPIILDGDPGHDDAIAWVIANASPMLDIKGITTCCGNTTIENSTYNALRICTLIGLKTPVVQGSNRPLFEEVMTAPSVHGESGLDGPIMPEPTFATEDMSAAEFIAKVVMESDEPITLVPTGPLTNIATFLMTYPELKEKIARISLMGGGIQFGNWTPAAEFNIMVDPEAANIVFRSGIPITMAGLDVTEQALVKSDDMERIRAINNPVAKIVAEWLDFFYQFHLEHGYDGAPMHDPVAVTALIAPEIFETKDMFVEVELSGDFCRGATVADIFGHNDITPNATVIMNLDREAFIEILIHALETYGEGEA